MAINEKVIRNDADQAVAAQNSSSNIAEIGSLSPARAQGNTPCANLCTLLTIFFGYKTCRVLVGNFQAKSPNSFGNRSQSGAVSTGQEKGIQAVAS